MMNRDDILGLIPHAGAMCLLDAVESWDDAQVICSSLSHRRADNPLRRGGALDALHLIEYAAQAAAVHGGLRGRRDGLPPAPGMLSSVRGFELMVSTLHDIDAPLHIEAALRFGDQSGWLYDVEVRAQRLLARGRLSVMRAWA